MVCPRCRAEMRDDGADRLDQSGATYLPARAWFCGGGKCEVTRVILRTGEPAQPYEWAAEEVVPWAK